MKLIISKFYGFKNIIQILRNQIHLLLNINVLLLIIINLIINLINKL